MDDKYYWTMKHCRLLKQIIMMVRFHIQSVILCNNNKTIGQQLKLLYSNTIFFFRWFFFSCNLKLKNDFLHIITTVFVYKFSFPRIIILVDDLQDPFSKMWVSNI